LSKDRFYVFVVLLIRYCRFLFSSSANFSHKQPSIETDTLSVILLCHLILSLVYSKSLSLYVCVCVWNTHSLLFLVSFLIFCFLMCTKPHSCLSRDDKRVVVVVGGVIAFSLFSLIFLDSFLLLLALCVCIYRDFTCPVLFSYSRPFGFDSFSLCFWCFSLTWSLVQFCVYWYKISTT
jgi:hypothetical protein